jgi:hypothetical protein
MHKNATKSNEILSKWCKNKYGASKIIDTLDTYQCHSASSCFLLFLCFRKVIWEMLSELDETKAEVPIYLKGRRSPEGRQSRTKRRPHHGVAQATPWPRHQVVWAPGPPPDIALPPINSLRRENPRGTSTFPRNILQAAAVVVPRLGGSRSSSRHPVG